MFTRRTATVTMSAPDAACACAMIGCEEYFPVPTMSRDLNTRPAMVNGESFIALSLDRRDRAAAAAPAADEIHDLNLVAVAHQRGSERVASHNDHVVFDGDPPGIDVQPLEQFLHGHWLLELVRVPVERNAHGRGLAGLYCTGPFGTSGALESFGSFGAFERSEPFERPERSSSSWWLSASSPLPLRCRRHRHPSVPASARRPRRVRRPASWRRCGGVPAFAFPRQP